jgi:predicted component of type VI protein secretion system
MAGAGGRVHSVFKVKAEGRARLIVFDTQDLSMGRSPDNDLAFDDPEMSRKHAIFVRTPEGCAVKDMGTPNGTGVNGEAVDHALLKTGDVVQVGEVEIVYAETNRDPASLGKAVEYASQLKAFSSPFAQGDGESTMLGLRSPVDVDGDPDMDKAMELYPTRDLDAELADLDASDSDVVSPEDAPVSADHVWELDESNPDLDGLDMAKPPGTGALTLRIELDGLDGELRKALQGLAGKLIELPKVRIKVESKD